MDDGAAEKQVVRGQELDQIMERVRVNTGDVSDSEGVIFIKDADPNRKDQIAANRVYDGLMLTLAAIADDSRNEIDRYRGVDEKRSQDYEAVIRDLEPITAACNALAEGTIPLHRVEAAEKYYQSIGDNVHSYIAGDFTIGNIPYDAMTVFIRPKIYVRPSSVKPRTFSNRPEVNLKETAEPRMTIRLLPRNSRDGTLEIRLDQEGIDYGMKITYDIVIGERDRLRDLKFDKDRVGQREGHHFNSDFTAKELGVSFEQILNAMNERIAGPVPIPGLGDQVPS